MRGLKLIEAVVLALLIVASFTDAWIETPGGIAKKLLRSVASFTDAWIETSHGCSKDASRTVASFTDAWIETREGLARISSLRGRIFYRCVD